MAMTLSGFWWYLSFDGTTLCISEVIIPRLNFTWGTQAYAVEGILKCGDKAIKDVEVHLIDVDTSIDPDDMMGKNKTDSHGRLATLKNITNVISTHYREISFI